MAWSRAFQKCIIYLFLDNFFLQTFLLYNWILQKKFNFCKLANFFVDFKSRVQELSNDVSFVIFGHQTWDLEGGSNCPPPPSVSWFSSTSARIGLIKKTSCQPEYRYTWDKPFIYKTRKPSDKCRNNIKGGIGC